MTTGAISKQIEQTSRHYGKSGAGCGAASLQSTTGEPPSRRGELCSTFIHFPRNRSRRPRKIRWRTGVTRVNPPINEPCPNRSGALRCKHEALADSDFQLSRGARGLAASAPRCRRERAPNPLLRSVLPEHADLPPPRASIHVRAQRRETRPRIGRDDRQERITSAVLT